MNGSGFMHQCDWISKITLSEKSQSNPIISHEVQIQAKLNTLFTDTLTLWPYPCTVKSKGLIIHTELRTVVIWGWGRLCNRRGAPRKLLGYWWGSISWQPWWFKSCSFILLFKLHGYSLSRCSYTLQGFKWPKQTRAKHQQFCAILPKMKWWLHILAGEAASYRLLPFYVHIIRVYESAVDPA